jgi:2'-5' RNA ligase
MTKRLFIGSLLAEEQRQTLLDLRKELSCLLAQSWNNAALRWVRPDKLHITWLFLGDCDEAGERAVRAILREKLAGVLRLSLSYEKLEIFGPPGRPKALVLLSPHAGAPVQELSSLIRKNLGHFCQKKEDLSFRPHLTLCRFPYGYRQRTVMPELGELARFLPVVQEISCLSLIESHLGGSRDSYQPLEDYLLSAQ